MMVGCFVLVMVSMHMFHAHVHTSEHECEKQQQAPEYIGGNRRGRTRYTYEVKCRASAGDSGMRGLGARVSIRAASARQQRTVGTPGGMKGRHARHTYEGKQRASEGVLNALIGHAGCPAAAMKEDSCSHAGERRKQSDKRRMTSRAKEGSRVWPA